MDSYSCAVRLRFTLCVFHSDDFEEYGVYDWDSTFACEL